MTDDVERKFFWSELMASARTVAEQRGERVRVVGIIVGRRPGRWEYVIECPSSCPCRRS
jgi:hypothetical protein